MTHPRVAELLKLIALRTQQNAKDLEEINAILSAPPATPPPATLPVPESGNPEGITYEEWLAMILHIANLFEMRPGSFDWKAFEAAERTRLGIEPASLRQRPSDNSGTTQLAEELWTNNQGWMFLKGLARALGYTLVKELYDNQYQLDDFFKPNNLKNFKESVLKGEARRAGINLEALDPTAGTRLLLYYLMLSLYGPGAVYKYKDNVESHVNRTLLPLLQA